MKEKASQNREHQVSSLLNNATVSWLPPVFLTEDARLFHEKLVAKMLAEAHHEPLEPQ